MITPTDLELIENEALTRFPHEMVGVLTENAGFIPMNNLAPNSTHRFEIDILEYRKLDKLHKVTGLVHSHTRQKDVDYGPAAELDSRTPSAMDVKTQKALGVPFYIVATNGEQVMEPICYPRDRNASLYQRPFIFFINDCYTLVSDYYWQNYQIKLMDHAPEFDWWNGGRGGVTIPYYNQYLEEAGFYRIDEYELEVGDIVIMGMGSKDGNHLGVFVEDYHILQHVMNHPSGIIPISKWKSYIQGYARHKDKPKK
jgi:cell wall-associated NlpC family hydrolase